MDVWRVAPVVTAYIFVAWLGCLADDHKSGGLSDVGVLSLGAALGKNAHGVDGKATQRMCPVFVTRTVLVGFLPWIQWCRRWGLPRSCFAGCSWVAQLCGRSCCVCGRESACVWWWGYVHCGRLCAAESSTFCCGFVGRWCTQTSAGEFETCLVIPWLTYPSLNRDSLALSLIMVARPYVSEEQKRSRKPSEFEFDNTEKKQKHWERWIPMFMCLCRVNCSGGVVIVVVVY